MAKVIPKPTISSDLLEIVSVNNLISSSSYQSVNHSFQSVKATVNTAKCFTFAHPLNIFIWFINYKYPLMN